jgi:hypothetical protein
LSRRLSYATAGVADDTTVSASRVAKFHRLLDCKTIDVAALKELSWSGVPRQFRLQVWQLLLVCALRVLSRCGLPLFPSFAVRPAAAEDALLTCHGSVACTRHLYERCRVVCDARGSVCAQSRPRRRL